MTETRIYVACLSSYNNGILHGGWIDCTISPEHIQNRINQILKSSSIEYAEEWDIHDHECFHGYDPRFHSSSELYDIALFLEEYEQLGGELMDIHGDLETAKEVLEDKYLGCYESLADYAEELTLGCYDIPKHLEFYIDYKAMARDMELNGEFYSIKTRCEEYHLFVI